MQSFAPVAPLRGSYPSPVELLENVAELFGAVHSIDRDNLVAFGVTADHLDEDALQCVFTGDRSTVRTSTLATTTERGDVRFIPASSGNDDPWVAEIETQDGVLEGTMSVWALFPIVQGNMLSVLVKVDGVVVARTPIPRTNFPGFSHEVDFALPIGAGTHLVEFCFEVAITFTTALAPIDVEWGEGAYFLRNLYR